MLCSVNGVADDSRKVKRGYLFVAVRGHDNDGHRFINDAIASGASAVVADRNFYAPEGVKKLIVKDARAVLPEIADDFYGHPSGRLKIVGVTGTNGKTTITYILESIITASGKSCGVIGTINYRIGGREITSTNTTPGPIQLQSLLSGMVKEKARYAVMEVSSHSLEQDRVARLLFDVAIFTNMTRDHLDYHKTLDKYFAAKARLFRKLKPKGVAVLNNDDGSSGRLRRSIRSKVLTYGISKRSDVMAKDIKLSIGSTRFKAVTPKWSLDINTALIGRHNISNILAAIAAATALGIKKEAIKKGIESFKSVPGRLEPVEAPGRFRVFVDYAHTEDALNNVLGLLKDVVSGGRIITVFGCGGDRDRTKRPLMGRAACAFSDRVVVTSDNPRTEDPLSIIAEIEKGVKGSYFNYEIVPDRRSAIKRALEMAASGDVVLIAGKGHEKYQIIGNSAIPFDDCKIARELLA
jgi:UDP-N-acetylmuramoyl-L-alanyl-D-glutamate--2,6-diaminopimelate ligase